jgi:hypothetical protein
MVSTYSPAFTHLPRTKAEQAFSTDVNHAVSCAVRTVQVACENALIMAYHTPGGCVLLQRCANKLESKHRFTPPQQNTKLLGQCLCCMSASHGPKPHRRQRQIWSYRSLLLRKQAPVAGSGVWRMQRCWRYEGQRAKSCPGSATRSWPLAHPSG